MKFIEAVIKPVLFGSVVMLSACNGGGGGSGGGSTGNVQSATPLSVVTAFGTHMALEGSWLSGCLVDGSSSYMTDFSITGTTMSSTTTYWPDTTTCSGISEVSFYAANLTLVGEDQITAWVTYDGMDINGPIFSAAMDPTTADGMGVLTPDSPFSIVTATVTEVSGALNYSIGSSLSLAFVIDNSGSYPVLYQVTSNGSYIAVSNMPLTDTGEAPVPPTSNGINVITYTGQTLDLAGTWVDGCNDVGGDGMQDVFVVTANSIEMRTDIWAGDATCSGTPTSSSIRFYGSASTGATGYLDEWFDSGMNTTAGPMAADGSGEIVAGVNFTTITISVTASDDNPGLIGNNVDILYVIDDTIAASPVMYFGSLGITSYAYSQIPLMKAIN